MSKRRVVLYYICISVLFVVFICISCMAGSVKLDAGDFTRVLLSHDNTSMIGKIIWDIRIPRCLAAIFLGGALALSGYLLQAFFANPIAGPFVLGISSGAKLFVAIIMTMALYYGFAARGYMLVIAALIGSFIATAFVLLVARKVKNMAILIVCGVMIGYICSAITELIVSFADDANIVNLHNWSMGSFSSIDWADARVYIPVIIMCLAISILMAKAIECFSYGEEYAISLGMNTTIFKVLLIVVSSVLSATVTAYAGPISFVGIAVPHIVRQFNRTGKPIVIIPATFLSGAVFCLASDIIARCLFAPTELSISTITAIFGAPVVISLMLKKKVR